MVICAGGHRSLPSPVKVAFFGHFGSSNSGNESTLLAILTRLRLLFPTSGFSCICLNPEVVAERDGIDGVAITTKVTKIWNRQLPLVRRVPMAFVGIGAELRQYARVFRELKGTDIFIVPGTGLLTDAYGLSNWGPYSLFKWTLMAKVRRCRLLFISVGAGPIDRRMGRALVKSSLSLADYRSYRDDASLAYLKGIGFKANGDRVYPDLVFSLPERTLPIVSAEAQRKRRVVGLGLMVYAGKYSVTDPLPETYTNYLDALAVFSEWLLDHDYDIRLLLGDSDTIVIDEFKSALEHRIGAYDHERVIERRIESIEDVLDEIAATDVVVATRFHNVLLALLLDKPVIAITFHHKSSSLMEEMHLSEYSHGIDDIDPERLIEQFRKLELNQDVVTRAISEGVQAARAALDDQYDLLFAAR
jgi:polysaccharide pyruvyl transferase WcaK-like protein